MYVRYAFTLPTNVSRPRFPSSSRPSRTYFNILCLFLLSIAVHVPRLGRRTQNEQNERANSNEGDASAEVYEIFF
jgi:hypothetical protein